MLGPIGSAVLTFIGQKQTNEHPDKQSIYIEVKKEKDFGNGNSIKLIFDAIKGVSDAMSRGFIRSNIWG